MLQVHGAVGGTLGGALGCPNLNAIGYAIGGPLGYAIGGAIRDSERRPNLNPARPPLYSTKRRLHFSTIYQKLSLNNN